MEGFAHAKEFNGKHVRLLRDITTRGNQTYAAGTVMIASQYSNRRHLLKLASTYKLGNGLRDYVTRVSVSAVEVVSPPPAAQADPADPLTSKG